MKSQDVPHRSAALHRGRRLAVVGAFFVFAAGCGMANVPAEASDAADVTAAQEVADAAPVDGAPNQKPDAADVAAAQDVADTAPEDSAPDIEPDMADDSQLLADVEAIADVPAPLPEPLTVCGSTALPGEDTLTSPLSSVPPCPGIWDLPVADVPDAGAETDGGGDAADAGADAPDAAEEVTPSVDAGAPPPPPPKGAVCPCPGESCAPCLNESSVSGCQIGKCSPDGFCEFAPDGTACKKVFDCPGTCQGGTCIFQPTGGVCGGTACSDYDGLYGYTAPAGTACGADACHPGQCNGYQTCVTDNTPINCEDENFCTDDSCDPKKGCQNLPANGKACSLGGVCGQCMMGACVAGAANLTPTLDFQFPPRLGPVEVSAEANGDVIAWGKDYGTYGATAACPISPSWPTGRHWIARIGPSGIVWQRWASETLGAYDYIRGRLSNGDLLVAAAAKPGDPVHLLRINAETGDICQTAFPAFAGSGVLQPANEGNPMYLDQNSLGVLLLSLPDDSVVAYVGLHLAANYNDIAGNVVHASLSGKLMPAWGGPVSTMVAKLAFAPRTVGNSVIFPSQVYYSPFLVDTAYDVAGNLATAFGGPTKQFMACITPGGYDNPCSAGVTAVGAAPDAAGNPVFWGAVNSTLAEASNMEGHAYALGQSFTTLPVVSMIGPQPPQGLSATPLPNGGIALKVGGTMAWTDASGTILGLTTLPEPYASMRLFARFPDGSLGFWSDHRIVRLPFSWATCP